MLKIQFKDKSQDPVWVMEKVFSIGSASKNHLTIDSPSVSLLHARILNQGDTFLLKDLGSEHGTFVNGRRITQKNIACGDTISFGSIAMEVIDLMDDHRDSSQQYWSFIADSSWLSGQEFPIIGKVEDVLSVGRSAQCDIVFPGTHLSRLHAEITINFSSLTINDMGSANGTFVNDKQITSAQLYPGDRVRLDVYSFRVFGPGITLPKSATSVTAAAQATFSAAAETSPGSNTKQWKSKPTSPGNREELNLYAKHHRQVIIAGAVVVAVLCTAAYVIFGILKF